MPLAVSRHAATITGTEVGDAIGNKRPRRQSSHTTPTLSDVSHKAMDEEDGSSDSAEEQDIRKRQALSGQVISAKS
jgi:hypothetical protein